MDKKLFVATVVLGGGVAIADPKFEYGKEEEVEKVKGTEWNASAEGGVVFTTGNSETTTATGGFKAARKTGQNKLAIEGSAAYARAGVRVLQDLNGNGMIDSDSEIVAQKQLTAEALAGKIRYDRFLTTFNSLFVAVLGSRDLPAGKEAVVGGQLGAVLPEDADRAAGRSLLPDRLLLVSVPAGLQYEYRRLGGCHRPGRYQCRDGHGHAALPGSGL